jgi:nitronate monooxygenase
MPLDDSRFLLGRHELVPLIIGGMGVNISTAELALEAARLGGIGHISDAGIEAVADMRFGTKFVREKFQRYRDNLDNRDKTGIHFDLDAVMESQRLHVGRTVERKTGDGLIFVNCMERLTMNDPQGTLRARLAAAMDAGIDGITLSAGLHLKSLALVQDHPRFRDVYFGIIVSSLRALKLFMRGAARVDRMPDYIVVEGPLAGGHLAFGPDDWHEYDLKEIFAEVLAYVGEEGLEIPVIPAGGVFTGADAVAFLEMGAAAVQVATRFTITEESGLPPNVKQEYLKSREEDIVVNTMSSSGYPMRMLKQSPCLHHSAKPQCEALGYVLDGKGECSYLSAYYNALDDLNGAGGAVRVDHKMCLCTEMRAFNVWTCGQNTYRLKDITECGDDAIYRLPTAEDVFLDYLHGK